MMVEYRLLGVNQLNGNQLTYEGMFNSEFLLVRIYKGESHGGDDNMFSIKTPTGSFEYYSQFKEDIEAVFDALKQVLCGAPVILEGIGWIKPVNLE
jgi:hypothetical protein